MKFGQLLYGEDEEIFLILSESVINQTAKDVIGRKLNRKEMKYLAEKSIAATQNLIIKIDSSGIGKEILLRNNPEDEGTFLVKWGFKDKDGNIVFKHYSYPANITEEEVEQIIGTRGKVFKRVK